MPLPDLSQIKNPYGPLIDFQTTNVLPPSAIYIGPNDGIFVQALIPTVQNVALSIIYRMLKADGTIATTVDSLIQNNSTGFNQTMTIPPQEGFLLSMVIRGSNVSRGQVFVRVFLNTGGGTGGGSLSHLFLQGYTSVFDAIAFPQSPIEGCLTGRGWLRNVVAGSSIGTPISVAVPANVHWLLRSISYTFTASAAVGNRVPFVDIRDAGGVQLDVQISTATIPASNSVVMFAAAGNTQNNLSGVASVGFVADTILTPGFTVEGNALGLLAGDTCGPMNFTVEEFVGQ